MCLKGSKRHRLFGPINISYASSSSQCCYPADPNSSQLCSQPRGTEIVSDFFLSISRDVVSVVSFSWLFSSVVVLRIIEYVLNSDLLFVSASNGIRFILWSESVYIFYHRWGSYLGKLCQIYLKSRVSHTLLLSS